MKHMLSSIRQAVSASGAVLCLFMLLLTVQSRASAQSAPSDWRPGYVDSSRFPPSPTVQPFGGGVWGANRRITSAGRFGGVRGTFTEPDFDIYKDPPAPTSPRAAYVIRSQEKYHQNKPTFYMGVSGSGVTIDSGFQWEQVKDQVSNAAPGWVLMISIRSSAWDNCWNYWATRNRKGKGALGKTDLAMQIVNPPTGQNWGLNPLNKRFYVPGSVVATAKLAKGEVMTTGLWQPYWHRQNNSQLQLAPDGKLHIWKVLDLETMIVRRVVGITQKTGAGLQYKPPQGCYYDNSYLRRSTFSDGQIAPVWQDQSNKLHIGSWKGWTIYPYTKYAQGPKKGQTVPGQNERWYRPDRSKGDPHRNPDVHPWIAGYRRWPVDFDEPYRLGWETGAESNLTYAQQAARYGSETVHINLFNDGKLKGIHTRLGKP